MVIAAFSVDERVEARLGREIAAIAEPAAVPHPKASVRDVEREFSSLGVVGVLYELKGHDVIALEPLKMGLDRANQVRRVWRYNRFLTSMPYPFRCHLRPSLLLRIECRNHSPSPSPTECPDSLVTTPASS